MSIRVLVGMKVKPGKAPEFAEHMAAIVARMKQEESGLLDVAWGETDLPDQFAFVARYRDEAALAFHKASQWDKEARPKTADLIDPAQTRAFTFTES